MSFSYECGSLDDEGLNRIRMELGDTDVNDYFLDDEEIDQIVSELSTFNARMYKCCQLILNRVVIKRKYSIEGYSESWDDVYKRLKEMRNKYGRLAAASYPVSTSLEDADKEVYSDDIDMIQPKFQKGIHDNP